MSAAGVPAVRGEESSHQRLVALERLLTQRDPFVLDGTDFHISQINVAGDTPRAFPLLDQDVPGVQVRDAAGIVPTGIAVQDGDHDDKHPKTGKRMTVTELIQFATQNLKVDHLFWCTQEPFYSQELIPLLRGPAPGGSARR
jgi:hypothetical protein